MSNFFDRFKPGGGNSNNNNNPIAGWFNKVVNSSNTPSSFSGTGQSLGGALPGAVIPITLSDAGPLGIRLEKSASTSSSSSTTTSGASASKAIVAEVVPDSQAAAAGLARGDVLCFAGSNGREEIPYEIFLELAASSQRPICFEVRRVPSTKQKPTPAAAAFNSGGPTSAEAYARKQAVIAAAEKRESEANKWNKKISSNKNTATNSSKSNVLMSTADRRKLLEQQQLEAAIAATSPLTPATQAALAHAKQAEHDAVQQLGYNPYESKSMTAGQARNAVATTAHGSILVAGANTNSTNTNSEASSRNSNAALADQQQQQHLPFVAPPRPLQAARGVKEQDTIKGLIAKIQQQRPSLEFQQAFETTVTSTPDHSAVVQTIDILSKLIVNATTKGQELGDVEAAAKYRKIRLTNAKIRTTIADRPGAVDLLLAVGFELHFDDDDCDTNDAMRVEEAAETILVFPPGSTGPLWLPAALQQMNQYIQPS